MTGVDQPQVQPADTNTKPEHSASDSHSHTPSDYAPYPKIDPNDVAPPPPSQSVATESRATGAATTMPTESNPYVSPAPVPAPTPAKNTLDSVKDVLGKWGKKAAEATKKAEDLAGNMWQHLKTGPSFADAAVGRIAQGTKVLAEGPVMGVLYLSSAKLAFCSDNPLSYQTGDQTQWSYYKVVIPLHQLRAVNPSTSKVNPSEKFIQIISVDNHEFWFMGFVNYDSAVKHIQEALQSR
ncbi:unnamed protein product [Vicia faba]|uniref:GRAM domain-containing protein n=1 Tax=Vicia faba TaxID=3906 RepID=A0AAV0ZKJ8_VICFA|nr:unnamed protein product [Vicia faba]